MCLKSFKLFHNRLLLILFRFILIIETINFWQTAKMTENSRLGLNRSGRPDGSDISPHVCGVLGRLQGGKDSLGKFRAKLKLNQHV